MDINEFGVVKFDKEELITCAYIMQEPIKLFANSLPIVIVTNEIPEDAIKLQGCSYAIRVVNKDKKFNNKRTYYVEKDFIDDYVISVENGGIGFILSLYANNMQKTNKFSPPSGYSNYKERKDEIKGIINRYNAEMQKLISNHGYSSKIHNLNKVIASANKMGFDASIVNDEKRDFLIKASLSNIILPDEYNEKFIKYKKITVFFNAGLDFIKSEFEFFYKFPFPEQLMLAFEMVLHPHVSINSICYGNRTSDVETYINSRYYDLFWDVVKDTITSYNPDRPYISFDGILRNLSTYKKVIKGYKNFSGDYQSYIIAILNTKNKCCKCNHHLIDGECTNPKCSVSPLYDKKCEYCDGDLEIIYDKTYNEQKLYKGVCNHHLFCPECGTVTYKTDNYACSNNGCMLSPNFVLQCTCGGILTVSDSKINCDNPDCFLHKDVQLSDIHFNCDDMSFALSSERMLYWMDRISGKPGKFVFDKLCPKENKYYEISIHNHVASIEGYDELPKGYLKEVGEEDAPMINYIIKLLVFSNTLLKRYPLEGHNNIFSANGYIYDGYGIIYSGRYILTNELKINKSIDYINNSLEIYSTWLYSIKHFEQVDLPLPNDNLLSEMPKTIIMEMDMLKKFPKIEDVLTRKFMNKNDYLAITFNNGIVDYFPITIGELRIMEFKQTYSEAQLWFYAQTMLLSKIKYNYYDIVYICPTCGRTTPGNRSKCGYCGTPSYYRELGLELTNNIGDDFKLRKYKGVK